MGRGQQPGHGEVVAERALALAPEQQGAHARLGLLVQLADAGCGKFFLRCRQQSAGLVDEHPARRNQALERRGGLAVERHLFEHVFAAFKAVD